MPLLQWLKNSLRTWLLEDDTDKDVSTELIVCIADRRIKAHAVEVAGRQLSCFVDSDGSANSTSGSCGSSWVVRKRRGPTVHRSTHLPKCLSALA
jgi:hypothetical protein